jgi:phage terminase large subunit GpA-like protein
MNNTREAPDLILDVRLVTRDGGDYAVRCPHCKSIIGIEGEDLSEIRGEQYQHRVCGGWLQVHHSARFVKELPNG